MTEEIINTDDYFYEITDESRGTIGYGCVSYKTTELVRRILKQNKQLKRLQETLKHTENGRKQKANKLKQIEEIVTHCIQGGFTDEFIQEIFDICREYEEV